MGHRTLSLLLLAGDYLLQLVSLVTALMLLGQYEATEAYMDRHIQLFLPLFLFWLLAFYVEGLYSLRSPQLKSLPISILRALLLGVLTSVFFFYLFPDPGITPKRNLVLIAFLGWPLHWLWHSRVRAWGGGGKGLGLAVWGDEPLDSEIRRETQSRPWLGVRTAARVSDAASVDPSTVDILVVDRASLRSPEVSGQLLGLLGRDITVMDSVEFLEELTGKVDVRRLDEAWFLEACGRQSTPTARLAKHALDKGVALMLMVLLAPVFAVLLPMLLVISGRPLFFSQVRTGRLGRPFTIWKLRTMVIDAEKDGALWATPGDARVTPVGRFLRKTRLDELPQLWNILRGEMSLVGPRPERPEIIETKLARVIPFYQQRHLVGPGVTGWAQVHFRYGFSADDAQEKLQYDLYYVKHQSFWLDVRILLKTAKTVLTGAGH